MLALHRTSPEAPLQHRPSPSPRGTEKPGGKGTLTELTLEPIGLPNLVDSDHWGAANFLQDVGQDLCFFWPEIMQKKKEICQFKATVMQHEPRQNPIEVSATLARPPRDTPTPREKVPIDN